MAVSAEKVSVGATATALNDGTPGRIIVSVPSGASASVYLGGPDVDTTDGFPLAASAVQEVLVDSGEILYGIMATGTQDVNVLRS